MSILSKRALDISLVQSPKHEEIAPKITISSAIGRSYLLVWDNCSDHEETMTFQSIVAEILLWSSTWATGMMLSVPDSCWLKTSYYNFAVHTAFTQWDDHIHSETEKECAAVADVIPFVQVEQRFWAITQKT